MPSGGGPGVRRLEQALERQRLTPRRAALTIGFFTVAVTIVGGALAWLTDRSDFHSLGNALWWSLQTVTTVGYGDVVPRGTEGRIIGSVVMVTGIGFLTVLTAAVTAALIETARGRVESPRRRELAGRLDEITARLAAIEQALEERPRP